MGWLSVDDWLTLTADEFCVSVRDGTHDSPKPHEKGRYLITSRHIIGGRIDLSKAYLISQEDFDEVNRRSKVDQWDVLITMIGTVGEACLVRDEPNFAIKNVGLFKSKNEICGKWLYYYLLSPVAIDHLESSKRGTTQAYIPLKELRAFPVSFPKACSEMLGIVRLLSALDDKIELNRQTNETLEALARALFKDWFVDFGPTRTKAEGGAPYLALELWALFPDALDDEDKPVGWEFGTVGDCFDLTMGQSPPGDTYNDEGDGLPFFQGRTDFGFRFPENRKFCNAPTRLASQDDTLVSGRAPVGDITIAWEKSCVGRGVAALRHRSGSPSFTYYSAWAIQQELREYEHTGTCFGAINKKQFEALQTIEPHSGVVSLFDETARPLDQRIRANEAESRTLAQTRDLLLPKLMSGEIRLRDAERAVEAVL